MDEARRTTTKWLRKEKNYGKVETRPMMTNHMSQVRLKWVQGNSGVNI